MHRLSLAIALGLLLFDKAAMAACTVPNSFSPGTTIDSSQVNTNFNTIAGCTTIPVPTRQVLTSGTSATYTTPANARQLRIRMVGGGGSGYGSGVGTDGGLTAFAGITANGGIHSSGADGALGGSAGTGSASLRIAGNGSQATTIGASTFGSAGAPGPFGGGGRATSTGSGTSAAANSGAGGAGAAPYSGGGGGEYLEIIINSPAATYSYTVGAGGVATGTAGNGGSGVIVVDEYY